jgi:hypothetical protein
VVSLDFIELLPRSGQVNCILVVVDKLSKYSYFIALSHPFTASGVAQAFLTQVYRLHGMPTTIISDRDKIFPSTFWQELFKLANVKLLMSSAYHPHTDSWTERVNQCMETFLMCFVHTCPKQWSKWLALAEYWYNTSHHASLCRSPFEVLYGHTPRHFGITSTDSSPVQELKAWLKERELMTQVIKQHLIRTQLRMKSQAHKKRSDVSFAMGDKVFLKLQQYVLSSLASRVHQKLAFKYFGSYEITARIGIAAYHLALPAFSVIHPVFHVS